MYACISVYNLYIYIYNVYLYMCMNRYVRADATNV